MNKSMTYEYLKAITGNKSFPLSATNDSGENIIIEQGNSDGDHYFRVTAAQQNGWLRTNCYYSSGIVTETYNK